MISAEIAQLQSWQQDDEGVVLQNVADVATLEDQANQTSYQIDLYDSLLVDLAEISINCGNEVNIKYKGYIRHYIQINISQKASTVSATEFFNFIFDFYIQLVLNNLTPEYWSDFAISMASFRDTGINCLSGSFEFIFIIIKIAITVYIEISKVKRRRK